MQGKKNIDRSMYWRKENKLFLGARTLPAPKEHFHNKAADNLIVDMDSAYLCVLSHSKGIPELRQCNIVKGGEKHKKLDTFHSSPSYCFKGLLII